MRASASKTTVGHNAVLLDVALLPTASCDNGGGTKSAARAVANGYWSAAALRWAAACLAATSGAKAELSGRVVPRPRRAAATQAAVAKTATAEPITAAWSSGGVDVRISATDP
jgi:hypothetical protein